jgi:5-methylcytosine-specific restriction endonuclease McrBC GTP-binding regulatory subunit McrB
MTLVLFDEMNLARTEYYFSDFLSKLELRRVDEKDASINLDIAQKTFNLPIPRNLLMIGTMNEDESTQTLSDKVLDRANVLRFGKPAKTKSSGKATPDALKAGGYINRVIWDQWINNPARKPTTENLAEVIAWIDKLNEAMALVGRPFGYRVQQAIVEYVKQYPALDQKAFRWAFADQIEQKLLPKLRGLDSSTQEFESCISQFEDVLKDVEDEELYTAFLNSKKVAQDQGLYIWTGVSR